MDELILETNEKWEREKSMWCFIFPGAPGIQPSNSLLSWGGDNIKNQEELQAKPRLLVLSLLHCIPYCVCWKYALTSSIWHWNDIRGIGDQARVEPLWGVCLPVWIWVCRKFTRIFFFFPWHAVLIADSLNQYDGQTTEDTTHPLTVLKGEMRAL